MRLRFYHIAFFTFVATAGCRHTERFPPGGYPYPDKVADQDTNFYFYPVRNVEAKKDSFWDAYLFGFYQAFKEPNLSLKPVFTPVFRLTYSGWSQVPIVIILKRNEILVKKGDQLHTGAVFDTSRLTPLERSHLELLNRFYPIEEDRRSIMLHTDSADNIKIQRVIRAHRHYLDSMGLAFPRLYDHLYFKYLVDKETGPKKDSFTFTLTRVKISPSTYDSFVDRINKSGYWRLPIRMKCDDYLTDGFAYWLEANTPLQYNFVLRNSCADPDTTGFPEACQALVDAVGMGKEIQLVWHGSGTSDTTTHAPFVIDVHMEPVEQKPQKHKKHS